MNFLKIALTMLIIVAYILIFYRLKLIDPLGKIGAILSLVILVLVPLMGAFFLAAVWTL